jgi:galactose oxidase
MANLGNAWHIPDNPEPRGRAGMRDPVGAIVPGTAVTIFSGNQFQGSGNPGNQLQNGSSIFFKRKTDAVWTPLPLIFHSAAGNNKYYSVTIPKDTFRVGDIVQYYLRIAYDDHDTTFLQASGAGSKTTGDETAARSTPFTFPVESSASRGEWGPVFALPNVAVHAHVLPNGLVLMWGRRDKPDQSLDVHECTPFLWNPSTKQVTNTPQPMLADGKTKINLFCSGHAFFPDGRLLVAGGHLKDSQGLDQATVYDPANNTWFPTALMNHGRWYPTATSLPDGSILVLSGSYLQNGQTPNNLVPQVWKNGTWTSIAGLPGGDAFELYPRMHVASDGLVFMSGPLAQTWSLNISSGGHWTKVAKHNNGRRDYAPSVMYDVDKIIYIGGGNEPNTHRPTAAAEIIDLRASPPTWHATNPMHFPRRQHNATILPDGTVLVTGGTRGGGGPGPNLGFNDLGPGQPVHIAELWNPATGQWTELAAEQVDRCYHATAVLLPDATVLSAGGGEYRPIDGLDLQNDPQDSHRDAQIISPPYLFKGARPKITSAPASVSYGETFQVGTAQPDDIGKVSWIRLSSVTHAVNMNQSINFLQSQVDAGGLRVTAPNSPNVCPPGHYMLFILSKQGVPSVAKIIQIKSPTRAPAAAAPTAQPEIFSVSSVVSRPGAYLDAWARRALVVEAASGTAVVVGITGTCPYGIGACWGGAHEALRSLERVHNVDPIPDADNSTATVFLEDEGLPALDQWDEQFRSMVNGSYELRGVEVSLKGSIEARDGELFLDSGGRRPSVQLTPLAPADKIQWNRPAGTPKPLEPGEIVAYERLAAESRNVAGRRRVTVTGPLKLTDAGYRLEVRLFKV